MDGVRRRSLYSTQFIKVGIRAYLERAGISCFFFLRDRFTFNFKSLIKLEIADCSVVLSVLMSFLIVSLFAFDFETCLALSNNCTEIKSWGLHIFVLSNCQFVCF